jgi:SAM-dependent methyltransferase
LPAVPRDAVRVHTPLELDCESFDLIWSISVFTHLTDNSIPWLLELHRVLKPGGLLIATCMGRWTSELLAGEPWDEDRIGINVLQHNHPASDGAPLVLISDWWLREHLGPGIRGRRDRTEHPQPELGSASQTLGRCVG